MLDLDNSYNYKQIPDGDSDNYFFVSNVIEYVKDIFGDAVKNAQAIIFYGEECAAAEIAIKKYLERAADSYWVIAPRGIILQFSNDCTIILNMNVDTGGAISETEDFLSYETIILSGLVYKHRAPPYNIGSYRQIYYTIDVTSKIKELFGDIVTSALQIVDSAFCTQENEVSHDICALEIAKQVLQSNDVNLSNGVLVVYFTNGKILSFDTAGESGIFSKGSIFKEV